MIELLNGLVPEEGVIRDIIEKVDLFRITNSSPRLPQSYDPGIIILAQGQKRIFIGDEVYVYNPLNYLVLSIPLPLECETMASPEKPLLGVKIKTDAKIVGEILLTIDSVQQNIKSIPKSIHSVPLDDRMTDATVRLLETLSSPADSRFLGPMIVREIIYRVLCGEKGDALRALAYRNQRFFQIARTLDKIHKSYGKKLDLNSLALETGMSISAFHASFKAVTNMAPLQYIKNVRLHKARMLMLEEGVNAYSAAFHVGYESPSQFNREYKRLFGLTPGKDTISSESGI
jgi:AraC-like DNA-binding protein